MSLNTLAMSRHLEEKGFTVSQSEATVETLMEAIQNSNLVTKDFLTVKMAELEARLETTMAQLETRITGNMIKWMVGLQFASFSLTVTVLSGMLYFLLKH